MNRICFALVSLFAVCLLASPLEAQQGFKLPSLNPFAKKKPAHGSISDDGPGMTTIPSAGGVTQEREAPKKTPAQPSSWQKLNSGTKTFFAKSKGVLMPWSKSKASKPPAQLTGTTKVYPGSAMAKKVPPKKSVFGSMFGGGETKKEPETVGDFLGQQRPPF